MNQKVVIIGHGFTSRLAVTRSVAQIGCEVILIVMTGYRRFTKKLDTTKPIDGYSKYVSKILYCHRANGEGLIQLLLHECTDSSQKVVIIPDSDFSAAVIDTNQERLREHFLFPHIHHMPGAVVAWMDKVKQKQTAKALGLDVAEGWVIEVKNGQYIIPNEIRYPCFPKPLATIVGGKSGLQRCDSEDELQDVIRILTKQKPEINILVEEFKKIYTEHTLIGFTDGMEVEIPGIIKSTSLANGGHFGVAKQGKILPVKGYEGLVEKFKQFVLKTGFYSIFDIDFYESEGCYYYCEMNFRYGGSGYAYTKSGGNLPELFVKMMINQLDLITVKSQVTEERNYVNERMQLDDLAAMNISIKKYNETINTSDFGFISDKVDCNYSGGGYHTPQHRHS